MAVSISDLVQRCRDILNDQPYETTSSTTTTSTTVAVPDGAIWSEGDVLEWQTGTVGYEQAYVQSVSVNDLLTIRGYGGTTAETHSAGARIVQNPSYFGRQLQQALTAAVKGLWPFVYKVEDIVLDVVGDGTDPVWWNLNPAGTDEAVGIVSAAQLYGTAPRTHIGYFGTRGGRPLEVSFNLPTSLAANGVGVRFPSGLYHATNDITVKVQEIVLGTSDIQDTGQFPVADSVVYTAIGRVVGAGEVPRVAVGSDLETTGSVGTGSRLQTGNFYTNQGKNLLEQLTIVYRNYYRPVWPGTRA